MAHQGSLDLRHIFNRGLAAVIRHSRIQLRRPDRHLVGHGSSPAEPGTSYFARGLGVGLEISRGSREIHGLEFFDSLRWVLKLGKPYEVHTAESLQRDLEQWLEKS